MVFCRNTQIHLFSADSPTVQDLLFKVTSHSVMLKLVTKYFWLPDFNLIKIPLSGKTFEKVIKKQEENIFLVW